MLQLKSCCQQTYHESFFKNARTLSQIQFLTFVKIPIISILLKRNLKIVFVMHTHTQAYVHTYVQKKKTHTHIYIYIYICRYILYILYTYIYIYIYIYFSLHFTLTSVKLKYIKIVYKVLPKLQIVNKLSKEF